MGKWMKRVVAVIAALVAPLVAARPASAAALHYQVKGKQAVASFAVLDTLTCSPGVTATMQTFVSVLSFETSIRSQGQLTDTLETYINVSSFNPCTFTGSFSSAHVTGGTLPMTALDRATLAGHFVLSDGLVLDLNLALTGTDTTEQGHFMQRQNSGKVMIVTRQIGSLRSASISGTATLGGRVISTAQMVNTDANLSRNTGGEILVIRPGS